MKTKILQPWFYGLIGIVGFIITFFSVAFAQVAPEVVEETPAPMVLDIASDGTSLLRGTVTEVGTDSLTVETWGGNWTVRINDDGSVIPANATGTSNDLSGISVGDFVGADGMIASDAASTIDASFVRNWTTNPLPGAFTDTTAISTSADTDTTTPVETTDTDTTDTTTTSDTMTEPDTATDTEEDNGFLGI